MIHAWADSSQLHELHIRVRNIGATWKAICCRVLPKDLQNAVMNTLTCLAHTNSIMPFHSHLQLQYLPQLSSQAHCLGHRQATQRGAQRGVQRGLLMADHLYISSHWGQCLTHCNLALQHQLQHHHVAPPEKQHKHITPRVCYSH